MKWVIKINSLRISWKRRFFSLQLIWESFLLLKRVRLFLMLALRTDRVQHICLVLCCIVYLSILSCVVLLGVELDWWIEVFGEISTIQCRVKSIFGITGFKRFADYFWFPFVFLICWVHFKCSEETHTGPSIKSHWNSMKYLQADKQKVQNNCTTV